MTVQSFSLCTRLMSKIMNRLGSFNHGDLYYVYIFTISTGAGFCPLYHFHSLLLTILNSQGKATDTHPTTSTDACPQATHWWYYCRFFFQVQSLVRGTWFQTESWSDLVEGTDCRTQDIEGGTYHITIWCLKPDSWLKFWSQTKI